MTTSPLNFYEILGISEDAGFDEIRAVYRRLAFQYHPDRNNDPQAQEFFQKIIEAFSVLSDPEKREDYDAILFSNVRIISSALNARSASELYDEVASSTSNPTALSERDKYLLHLRKSRRRRAVVQTLLTILVIFLLLFYGFKPLRASSGGVAATGSSTSSSVGQSSTDGSSGSSLNQNLIVIQGADGPQGIAGPAGRDGRIGVDGIPGPAGATGADGAPGPAGANGQDGAAGPAGPAGPAGASGAQGPAGAAGAQGPAGPAGRDGQDATVYTVKPNLGGAQGMIAPCNQDLSDTSTAPGLDVTIDTRFEPTTQKYMIAAINLKGFTASCRGVSVGVNMVLASNATSYPNATFQCIATLPSNFTAPYTHSFVSGGAGCTKYSGTWGTGPLDLGNVIASDLAKINLIVSG